MCQDLRNFLVSSQQSNPRPCRTFIPLAFHSSAQSPDRYFPSSSNTHSFFCRLSRSSRDLPHLHYSNSNHLFAIASTASQRLLNHDCLTFLLILKRSFVSRVSSHYPKASVILSRSSRPLQWPSKEHLPSWRSVKTVRLLVIPAWGPYILSYQIPSTAQL